MLKKDPRPPRPPVDIVVKNSETVQEDTAGKPMWRISAREIRASEAATTLQVLAQLLAEPFLALPPPRSTGRAASVS